MVDNKKIYELERYLQFVPDNFRLAVADPSSGKTYQVDPVYLIHQMGRIKYNPDKPYKLDEVVSHAGYLWESKADNNKGITPGDNVAQWFRLGMGDGTDTGTGYVEAITVNGDTANVFTPDPGGTVDISFVVYNYFKGQHKDETALNTAHPTGIAGDRAYVEDGVGGVTVWAWNVTVAAWQNTGISADGGDMYKDFYDPRNIAKDVFDLANHTGQIQQNQVVGLPTFITDTNTALGTFVKNIYVNGVLVEAVNQEVFLEIDGGSGGGTGDNRTYVGTAGPAAELGAVDDVYIRSNGDIFEKEGTGWLYRFTIAGGGGGSSTGIFAPVADLAALKALDTTDAATWPDKWIIHAETLGLYALDRESTATADDNLVIAPTTGAGRWLKKNVSGAAGKIRHDTYTALTLSGTMSWDVNNVAEGKANISIPSGTAVADIAFSLANAADGFTGILAVYNNDAVNHNLKLPTASNYAVPDGETATFPLGAGSTSEFNFAHDGIKIKVTKGAFSVI